MAGEGGSACDLEKTAIRVLADRRRSSHSAQSESTPYTVQQIERDTLIPVMNVESIVKYDMDGNLVTPTKASSASSKTQLFQPFGSLEVIYTKPDSKMRPLLQIKHPKKCEHQYHSHETLPTEKTTTKLGRLTRTKSEHADADEDTQRQPSVVAHNRWGLLQSKTVGQTQTKKDKRRAQIVAAVTRRLFSVKKVAEKLPEPIEVPETKEEEDDGEPEELKICSRARATLQELTRKALGAHRKAKRSFAEAETQTEFFGHVLRVKEIGVGTESEEKITHLDGRSKETQCSMVTSHVIATNTSSGGKSMMDEVYRQWCYHSKNGRGLQNAKSWNYFTDSVVVTEHRFIKSNEEDLSDDSLDSNHDIESQTGETEKPCVWKVLTITSGQKFTNGITSKLCQPTNNKAPSTTPTKSDCPPISNSSKLTDKTNNTNRENSTIQIMPSDSTHSDTKVFTSDVCHCHDMVKELHKIISNLQSSVEESSRASCFIQLCDCNVRGNSQQICRHTQTDDTNINTTEHLESASPNITEVLNFAQVYGTKNMSLIPDTHTCKLSNSRIYSFLSRWKNKCTIQSKIVNVQGIDSRPTKVKATTDDKSFCSDVGPDEMKKQRHDNRDDTVDKPSIFFLKIPFGYDESSGMQTINFKALSGALYELINNNNYLTVPKDLASNYKPVCRQLLENYLKGHNSSPLVVNPNGKIVASSSSVPPQSTAHLSMNRTEDLGNNEQDVNWNLESRCQKVDLNREQAEKRALNECYDQSRGAFYDDNLDLSLPRTVPSATAKNRTDNPTKHQIDADTEHWMEIKNIILGTNYESFTEEKRAGKRNDAKKCVSWKDEVGCGDLVEARSISPNETTSYGVQDEEVDFTWSGRDQQHRDNGEELCSAYVLFPPRVSTELKNDQYDTRQRYSPSAHTELHRDSHTLSLNRRKDILARQESIINKFYNLSPENTLNSKSKYWSTKIYNTILSRSNYYDGKLDLLSHVLERRRRRRLIQGVEYQEWLLYSKHKNFNKVMDPGEKLREIKYRKHQCYSNLISYVNNTKCALDDLLANRQPIGMSRTCHSNESKADIPVSLVINKSSTTPAKPFNKSCRRKSCKSSYPLDFETPFNVNLCRRDYITGPSLDLSTKFVNLSRKFVVNKTRNESLNWINSGCECRTELNHTNNDSVIHPRYVHGIDENIGNKYKHINWVRHTNISPSKYMQQLLAIRRNVVSNSTANISH